MIVFVLLVSVPAFLFCCLALMHFQREILRSERIGSPAGNRISLDRQDEPLTESAASRCEVYQLEGAYLGPFFVVRAENGRDW